MSIPNDWSQSEVGCKTYLSRKQCTHSFMNFFFCKVQWPQLPPLMQLGKYSVDIIVNHCPDLFFKCFITHVVPISFQAHTAEFPNPCSRSRRSNRFGL